MGKQRLTDEQAAELVAAYVDGARITELMDRFRLSRRAVHDYLDRSGVPKRTSKPRKFDDLHDAMAAEYASGLTLTEVAAKHGASKETVRRALRDQGVERRPAGWPTH